MIFGKGRVRVVCVYLHDMGFGLCMMFTRNLLEEPLYLFYPISSQTMTS